MWSIPISIASVVLGAILARAYVIVRIHTLDSYKEINEAEQADNATSAEQANKVMYPDLVQIDKDKLRELIQIAYHENRFAVDEWLKSVGLSGDDSGSE